MAETALPMPPWRRANGQLYIPRTKVYTASEQDNSVPARKLTFVSSDYEVLTMYLNVAGYTAVTVKLQASPDDGVTWIDIPSSTLTATATFVTLTNLCHDLMAVNVAGTLSAGADSVDIWLLPILRRR